MTVERRRSERKRTFFAVELDSGEKQNRIGVSRDVSVHGMLVASPSRFEIGEELVVRVFFNDRSSETLQGRVLRVEQNVVDSDEPWKYRFALAFEDESPALVSRAS
jgi:hypothetical protein